MRIPRIASSEITDESVFLERRRLLRLGASAVLAATLAGCPGPDRASAEADDGEDRPPRLPDVDPAPARFRVEEPNTDWEDATGYNNFYEFGTGKRDPARHAHLLQTEPWSVVVDGEVGKPGRIGLEDLIGPNRLEERVYRFRCVETWSMVIPAYRGALS